tara:strand:- start:789 stop:1700 length:912 start_codon:yes stop_codon:yes gene_type:complete
MPQLTLEKESTWSYLGHAVHTIKSDLGSNNNQHQRQNKPAILLIHGFGASTQHWRYNIPVLSKSYEVHALDLLGFGKSSKPAELVYGGALWRDQLVAYVKEKIQKPTVLVGNSLGGYAALAAGASLSENTAGVVLLNAAGYFTGDNNPSNSIWAKTRKFIGGGIFKDPFIQRLIFENLRRPGTIRRTLNQVYIDKTNVDDELIEAIRKPSLDPGAFTVFRSVFNPGGPPGQPLDELFSHLNSPVLLLWGNRDPWMNAPGKRQVFKKYAPNADEVILDAGHCPHDEVPDQVNEAMLNWLESIKI